MEEPEATLRRVMAPLTFRAPDSPPLADVYRERSEELRALIAKATQEDLADGGRYFRETLYDFAQCRHEEIGEYQNRHDGPLVEWLWNNRAEIVEIYRTAANVAATMEAK